MKPALQLVKPLSGLIVVSVTRYEDARPRHCRRTRWAIFPVDLVISDRTPFTKDPKSVGVEIEAGGVGYTRGIVFGKPK